MMEEGDRLFKSGYVYFAGVGPGDVELLTCKARKLIESADVILYAGSLINPEILSFAPQHAILFDTSQMTLAEQIEIMVSAAKEKKIIARLHSGDPSIYGSITEQINELCKADISYSIIPGVSSAFAAAAALGIEYTLPQGTQTVIFTRVAGKTKVPEQESIRYLGKFRTTLVIFLSTSLVDDLVNELKEAGYDDSTPIAFVYRASWNDEVVLRSTLGEIAEKIREQEFTHQGLFVISPALEKGENQFSYLYGGFQKRDGKNKGIAVITLTFEGAKLGLKLLDHLEDSILYIPYEVFAKEQDLFFHSRIKSFRTSVRPILQEAFSSSKGLICIMAAGLVVREIAPLLKNKHSDPAVIVMDVHGNYVVSLLSGHEGGANELAKQIAKITGGQAVITTTSDTLDIPPIDVLAKQRRWELREGSQLARCLSSLINGDDVFVVQELEEKWLKEAVFNAHLFSNLEEIKDQNFSAVFYIGIRKLPNWLLKKKVPYVFYHPKKLVIGIGCNKGTSAEEILAAIKATVEDEELAIESVRFIATIAEKAAEKGVLDLIKSTGWELKTVTAEQINELYENKQKTAHGVSLMASTYAKEALGVWGVAEPSAVLIAKNEQLLVSKKKIGNVTVAAALMQEED